jgi:hypothetical protein
MHYPPTLLGSLATALALFLPAVCASKPAGLREVLKETGLWEEYSMDAQESLHISFARQTLQTGSEYSVAGMSPHHDSADSLRLT